MKQHEAVIQAMEENGGYATLGQLYQAVPRIPDCEWRTKTPFASIRRIVQTHDEFFKVRPGLWALSSHKERVLRIFSDRGKSPREREYSHYFYQGLVVEIGNLKGFQTYVPSQDKNRPFGQHRLGDVSSLASLYPFTYDETLRRAQSIDVIWFNARNFPDSFFEVEHSTDIYNSLLKFVEFQDFRVNCRIVADDRRRTEFEDKLALSAFEPIRGKIEFWDYDSV
ncbi:MAG TPA: hypothetical protein VIU39_12680, partial [Anaerolineales bacterium]